jgi:protein involved in polysaccharide export with SLBB domain
MRFSILLPLSLTAACPIWLLVLADFLHNKSVAKTNRIKQAALQAEAKQKALRVQSEVAPELPPVQIANAAPIPVPSLPNFSNDYTSLVKSFNTPNRAAKSNEGLAKTGYKTSTSNTTQSNITQSNTTQSNTTQSNTTQSNITQTNQPTSNSPETSGPVPAIAPSLVTNAAPEAIAQPSFSSPSTSAAPIPTGRWQLNYTGISESSSNTFSQTAATQMIAMNQTVENADAATNPIYTSPTQSAATQSAATQSVATQSAATQARSAQSTSTAIARTSQTPAPVNITTTRSAAAIVNSSSESLLAGRVPTLSTRLSTPLSVVAPVVVPVDETYQLGGGDRLLVTIKNAPEWSGEKEVTKDGTLNLPKVGTISVKGLTLKRAEEAIANHYQPHLSNPVVSVNVVQARPLQISISGAAQRPGAYLLSLTDRAQFPKLTEALQAAGGTTASANLRRIEIRRPNDGRMQTITVNLASRSQRQAQNIALRDGDVIFIPMVREANRSRTPQLAISR